MQNTEVSTPMIEHFFNCPHCFQKISVLVDRSISEQEYIEDCEVCCNPLLLSLAMEEGEIIYFDATPAQ
ncbi:CPXCG motif-containing cysteine-rich protein [Marivirga lumbricoides]